MHALSQQAHLRYALPGPALLCAVAVLVAITSAEDLRTSKGGRFAMFSVFEGRKTQVHLLTGEGQCLSAKARFAPEVVAQMERVANAPSSNSMDELLDRVRAEDGVRWAGTARDGASRAAGHSTPVPKRVLIEVWALDYRVADLAAGPAHVRARKIATAQAPWIAR